MAEKMQSDTTCGSNADMLISKVPKQCMKIYKKTYVCCLFYLMHQILLKKCKFHNVLTDHVPESKRFTAHISTHIRSVV